MDVQLQDQYLIAALMEQPERADDHAFYQILKMAGKSMLEQISKINWECLEYKEHFLVSDNCDKNNIRYLDILRLEEYNVKVPYIFERRFGYEKS